MESLNEGKGEVTENRIKHCVSPVRLPSNMSFLCFSCTFHLPFQTPKSLGLSCLLMNVLNVHMVKFIFGIKLYMFRTVPLSIIRSFSLYTQQWYVIQIC